MNTNHTDERTILPGLPPLKPQAFQNALLHRHRRHPRQRGPRGPSGRPGRRVREIPAPRREQRRDLRLGPHQRPRRGGHQRDSDPAPLGVPVRRVALERWLAVLWYVESPILDPEVKGGGGGSRQKIEEAKRRCANPRPPHHRPQGRPDPI